ncbi:MAG TPA: DHA2 family efflux MFS transporter permease subunit [Chlamydiales bacterium]|nr:DHA2 family efflux MFS transporter permease subunit [Chlamydiales bacterium]
MQTVKLTPIQRVLFFIAMSLATFMMVLDYSIANISIPYIAGDLSVSTDQGTYVITSFAVGNAVGLAMTGWLTRRVGQIRLIVISIALFTLWSWICGLSVSLGMLVISRFIQGLVAGPIIPLSQSLIIEAGTPENRARDLAIWTTIIIVAPVLGPIMGGYISYWYGWPWIFYINIPIGIFCVFATWLIMRDRESETDQSHSDIPGIILLVIGVACLQILLDKGQQWDWWNSIRIRFLIIGAILGFTYLIIQELWSKTPFLNLRLFRIPSFALSIICLMVSYAIYFGTIVIVPLWLQEYMGYDAVNAGIAVSALGIGSLLLGFLTPIAIRKIGNLMTLLIGFIIFGAACFYTAYFTTAVDMRHIAFSRFFFGLGFGFYIAPLIGMSVQDVPMEQLPNATGIFHFIRAMVGAIGTSVFVTLFQRRTIFHHHQVGNYMTLSNPVMPQTSNVSDLAQLNDLLDQQAALLAINDAFFLMGWCFVALIVLMIAWRFYRRCKGITEKPTVHIATE